MLATIGDLVEDVVVHVASPLAIASDTDAIILRRRGGSAANVAVDAVVFDNRHARFIGQVGDDAAGRMLIDQLAADGVDVAVRRRGRTGTVICMVDANGERTMLPDPGASRQLVEPRMAWLDGVDWLHVPAYGLLRAPMDAAIRQVVTWSHQRGIKVSVDASSSGLLTTFGVAAAVEVIASTAPELLLVNTLEADVLSDDGLARIGARVTVVKHGPSPARVTVTEASGATSTAEVPAADLGAVRDTTGAGDAFAAGMIGGLLDRLDPVEAARHGHAIAAMALRELSRTHPVEALRA